MQRCFHQSNAINSFKKSDWYVFMQSGSNVISPFFPFVLTLFSSSLFKTDLIQGFRENMNITDPAKLSIAIGVAHKGLLQLQTYTTLPKSNNSWTIHLDQQPMPPPDKHPPKWFTICFTNMFYYRTTAFYSPTSMSFIFDLALMIRTISYSSYLLFLSFSSKY